MGVQFRDRRLNRWGLQPEDHQSFGTATGISGTFEAALYSNNGPGDPGAAHYSQPGTNTPGSLIAILSGDPNPNPAGGFGYLDYSANVTLSPNTYYWMVYTSNSPSGGYSPVYNRGGFGQTGKRVETMADSPSGASSSWSYAGFPEVNMDMTISVDAPTAVPEPSTFVLGALGLLGLGVVACRK